MQLCAIHSMVASMHARLQEWLCKCTLRCNSTACLHQKATSPKHMLGHPDSLTLHTVLFFCLLWDQNMEFIWLSQLGSLGVSAALNGQLCCDGFCAQEYSMQKLVSSVAAQAGMINPGTGQHMSTSVIRVKGLTPQDRRPPGWGPVGGGAGPSVTPRLP